MWMVLVVEMVTGTDPRDFSRLCDSGECPGGWSSVGGHCVLFSSGWEEGRAREVCRQEGAEYREYVLGEGADSSHAPLHALRHALPVCLVRRETQCECWPVTSDKGGESTSPWQGRFSLY